MSSAEGISQERMEVISSMSDVGHLRHTAEEYASVGCEDVAIPALYQLKIPVKPVINENCMCDRLTAVSHI